MSVPPAGHVAAHHKYQTNVRSVKVGGSSGLSSCGDKATGLTECSPECFNRPAYFYRHAHAKAHKRFDLMPTA